MCLFTRTHIYNAQTLDKELQSVFQFVKIKKGLGSITPKKDRRSWKSVKSFCSMQSQVNWKLIEPYPNIQLTNQSDMKLLLFIIIEQKPNDGRQFVHRSNLMLKSDKQMFCLSIVYCFYLIRDSQQQNKWILSVYPLVSTILKCLPCYLSSVKNNNEATGWNWIGS